jgi:hypothetical protein
LPACIRLKSDPIFSPLRGGAEPKEMVTMDEQHEQRTNGPNDEHIQEAFEQILRHYEELDSERGEYMRRCRSIRDSIASVYGIASDRGITKKLLKAKIKTHLLEKKIGDIEAEFEADERDEYERINQALGEYRDTPLGQAALSRAQRDRDELDNLAQ